MPDDRVALRHHRGREYSWSARRVSDPCNRIVPFFLVVRPVLVNLDRRGVDHLDIAVLSL
jgi:hypothetical protein